MDGLIELFGDEEMGKMMVQNFGNTQFTPDAFMKIYASLVEENWDILVREAHSLKGACR